MSEPPKVAAPTFAPLSNLTRGLQPRPLVGALEYLSWSEWKFRSNYLFVVHTASLVVQMWLVVVWWPWWWSKEWRG